MAGGQVAADENLVKVAPGDAATAPHDTRRRTAAVAGLVTLIAVILGFNLVVLKVAIAASDPLTTQTFAVIVATVSFVAAAAVSGPQGLRLPRRYVPAVVGVALSLTAGSSVGIAFGVERVEAGVAALLISTTPIITAVLEYFIVGQRHTWHGVAGILLGFAGVAVVALGEQRSGGASQVLGVVFLLLGSFGWSLGLVLMRTHAAGAPRTTLLAWQFLVATPLLVVTGLLTTGLRADWSLVFVLAVVYSGLFGKGISFFLQMTVVRLGTALHASLTAFLMPVSGTLAGVWFLHETVELPQVVGAVTILAGVVLVLRAKVLVQEEAGVPTI